MRCPGQDPRYWTGSEVFEVPCPRCGHAVELFRDETSARCPKCRHRFRNPKLDLSCAQWCAHAEQCVGTTAPSQAGVNLGEGVLASCLLQQLRDYYCGHTQPFTEALVAFQHARQLAADGGGDAGVIFAVTLFWQVAVGHLDELEVADVKQELSKRAELLKRMFAEACLPGGIAERAVDTLLAAAGRTTLPLEGQIACDAWKLTRWGAEYVASGKRPTEQMLRQLHTDAARRRARNLLLSDAE